MAPEVKGDPRAPGRELRPEPGPEAAVHYLSWKEWEAREADRARARRWARWERRLLLSLLAMFWVVVVRWALF